MITSILMWIVLGALVGWLASIVMNTDDEQGGFGNIIVGILGAFVGGFLVRGLTGAETSEMSLIGELLVAFIGAVIVLFVWKGVRHHARE